MSDHHQDDYDEEDRLLERHIEQNQTDEPQKTTLLRWQVAGVTVLSISYLFQAVIDMNFFEPINFILFLAAGGVTAFILAEAYQQTFETESLKGYSDATGLWIRELEDRSKRTWDRVKNKNIEPKMPSVVRTAVDIFLASGKTPEQWKALDKAGKQEYFDQEMAEECAVLQAQAADLKHLQYQQRMGWSLFQCNVVFVGLAVVVSNVMLRSYDARVNFLISTLATALATQLFSKRNEESTKTASKKKTN
eukprot:TRINITY_DN910_c0_g1_i1.p3 TRINITY_DN910_c0_g1~~TRINITY_DN910_c0_g1_i1.p3  ORF type:complete len:249 (+),score=155.62 TRINITY_DN910_c0_g1_i1:66-812(+)